MFGRKSWSRTSGELGPLAGAAGLGLREATHLLAQGGPALEGRARGRGSAAVQVTWSDVLRQRSAR